MPKSEKEFNSRTEDLPVIWVVRSFSPNHYSDLHPSNSKSWLPIHFCHWIRMKVNATPLSSTEEAYGWGRWGGPEVATPNFPRWATQLKLTYYMHIAMKNLRLASHTRPLASIVSRAIGRGTLSIFLWNKWFKMSSRHAYLMNKQDDDCESPCNMRTYQTSYAPCTEDVDEWGPARCSDRQ